MAGEVRRSVVYVAWLLKVDECRVREVAIEHRIGRAVTPRTIWFTDEDVERLREIFEAE